MSWTIPNLCDIFYDDANFLDGQSQLSFFLRTRIDSLLAGQAEYIFAHPGSTSKITLRKHETTEKLRFAVTVNSSSSQTREHATAPTEGTKYSIAGTWKQNDASGMVLYVDGAISGSAASTTSQNYQYDTGGGIDLRLGSYSAGSSYGRCSLQDFMLWAGHILTSAQVASLHKGKPWWKVRGLPKPSVWYRFDGKLLSRIPDLSGRGRNVESSGIDAVTLPTDGGMWYPSTSLLLPRRSRYVNAAATGSGPPEPNPWTLVDQEILHPTAAALVTGLSNGTTYEFKVTALDLSGNESSDSAVAEVTPAAPAPPAVSYPIPWRRGRRISKYRSTSQ